MYKSLDIFKKLKKFNTYVIVIEDLLKNQIAAAGTLLIELKFLRGGGLVGHIEDIVTDKNYRGKNLGKMYAWCVCFYMIIFLVL